MNQTNVSLNSTDLQPVLEPALEEPLMATNITEVTLQQEILENPEVFEELDPDQDVEILIEPEL